MRKAWLRIVQQSAREGLGLIARNDKEIVAARLTLREQRGVPHSKDPDEESIPDNIAGMFKFIKVSGNAVDIFDKYQVDEYAHFFGIVSKPEYGGRGYAQKLLNLSYDLLRSEGFKYVKVETGNPILFHVFEKHGYELVHRTTMKEFTFKGVVPVDKDDEWRVLVKKL
ncbi:unnamed protein product [Cyprideis torosa]|uniref:Uncharacterized protein n=1 Tax=Cyprideis torosa TaxID=163714 RepID=A0A7R8ZVI4_9CRUS|nr:unnamed protein product [Cyprideis torosa]CAG0903299.1 unnamed protein product [Cyprideis torosa]